jgi:hypothetical protein
VLRAPTARKWGAIAKARRWTFTELADALADDYLERNPIPVEEPPTPAGGETPDDGPLVRGRTDIPRPAGPVALVGHQQSALAADTRPGDLPVSGSHSPRAA